MSDYVLLNEDFILGLLFVIEIGSSNKANDFMFTNLNDSLIDTLLLSVREWQDMLFAFVAACNFLLYRCTCMKICLVLRLNQ